MGLASVVGVALAYPFATIIAHHSQLAAYLFFTLVILLRNVAATFSYTSSMVMVNLAAPKEHIGSVNGAGQTLASFVRGFGPAIGGTVWSLSVATGVNGSQFVVFALIATLAACGVALYSQIRPM